MMVKKIIIFLLALFLGLYSCKKDTSSDYPAVQISTPYSLATFNVPGNIQVTGHVSDAKNLTSVTVYIGNNQNTPSEQVVSIPITSNNMNVSCTYSLNDIHMASGQYYMTITASNGINQASAFQQIYVNALPTQRTALYAITHNVSGVHVWGITGSSAFTIDSSYSYAVPGDYSSSDINSYYQQLYIAGHDSGNVNVYSVPNSPSSLWTINGYSSPAPYFTNVYCNDDAEFISYYNNNMPNGVVKCFNHSGAGQGVYNAIPGNYPIKTILWNGFLFVEEKQITSQQEALQSYYQSSAVQYKSCSLPGTVVAMYEYDNNDIFIFGNNSSGGAYIQLYSYGGNTDNSYFPFSLSSYGNLLSVAQINPNTYLVGFSNGNIYQCSYSNSNENFTPYITGVIASTIRYDNVNNEIIIASGKTVSQYSYANPLLAPVSIHLSDSVLDVHVLYNK